jgi:hypothetical protein
MSNSKALYKHSLPIVMLSLVVLVLSFVSLSGYSSSTTVNTLRRGLLTSSVKVSPTIDGLARVSLNHNINLNSQTQQENTIQTVTINAGETALLSVVTR